LRQRNGVAITANKHKEFVLLFAGAKNSLNCQENIIMQTYFVSLHDLYVKAMQKKMVQLFINTPFEGGRHQRRVEKIAEGC
jgi:ribose 5-phosphate isomerase B